MMNNLQIRGLFDIKARPSNAFARRALRGDPSVWEAQGAADTPSTLIIPCTGRLAASPPSCHTITGLSANTRGVGGSEMSAAPWLCASHCYADPIAATQQPLPVAIAVAMLGAWR